MDIKSKNVKNLDENKEDKEVKHSKEGKKHSEIKESKQVKKEGIEKITNNKKRLVLLIISFFCIAYIIITCNIVIQNSFIFVENGFYASNKFQASLYDVMRQIGSQTNYYKSEEYIKNDISTEEFNFAIEKDINRIIDPQRQNIYRIESQLPFEDKYSSGTTTPIDKDEEKVLRAQLIIERETLNNLISTQKERVTKEIIGEKLEGYEATKRKLERDYSNLKYLAIDEKTNTVNSNVEFDEKDKEKIFREEAGLFIKYLEGSFFEVVLNGKEYTNKPVGSIINNTIISVGREFNLGNKTIYISIPNDLSKKDVFNNDYKAFKGDINRTKIQCIGLIVAIIILLIAYKLLKKLKQSNIEGIIIDMVKKIYIEARVGIVIVTYAVAKSFATYRSYDNIDGVRGITYDISVVSMVMTTLTIVFAYIAVKSILVDKSKETMKNESVGLKLYNSFNDAYTDINGRKKAKIQLLVLTIIEMVVLFFICSISNGDSFSILIFISICIIFVNVSTFLILNKRLVYLNEIVEGTKRAVEGNLSCDIPIVGRDSLTDLAYNINNIRAGLKESIRNEMKSEQTKAELITNVSHDLKTPLTSIINYVDLLKKEKISPDVARDYVEILDRKSQRLKVLIEDLFEVSKAASGTIELNIEKVDIGSLLRQSLAEMNDKIEASNLDFRNNIPSEKIYILADGKRMWRIFENLISNIVKYSLTATRVYIDIKAIENKVEIQFKNISAYELNFNPMELTERFKRGDESRNTEGSGLGLAIASSLTSLQGGEFNIDTDGDLFKVVVKFDIIQ